MRVRPPPGANGGGEALVALLQLGFGGLEHGRLADRRQETGHSRVLDAPGDVHADDSLHGRLRLVVTSELVEKCALVAYRAIRIDGACERLLALEQVVEAAGRGP